MSFRVKTVCRLTGIHRSTLLAWERRYAVVVPTRAENGYRTYTQQDVDRLRRLKSLVDAGHAVSEALELVSGTTPGLAAGLLLERLGQFDGLGAEAIADDVQGSASVQVSQLYMPLLSQLGDAWERGETSVAQEHFASGFVRRRLSRLLQATRRDTGPLATLFTPPGEHHELGLMGLGIRLNELGWQTDWLGAQLPLDELSAYCRKQQPTMVCASLVRLRPEAERVRLLKALREVVPADIRLVVGGRGAQGAVAEGVHIAVGFNDLLRALAAP